MKFDYCLLGFKTFKNNLKEIYNFSDFLAVIMLVFSLGIMCTKIKKEIKNVLLAISFLAALPALIKTVIAVLSGISAAKYIGKD